MMSLTPDNTSRRRVRAGDRHDKFPDYVERSDDEIRDELTGQTRLFE